MSGIVLTSRRSVTHLSRCINNVLTGTKPRNYGALQTIPTLTSPSISTKSRLWKPTNRISFRTARCFFPLCFFSTGKGNPSLQNLEDVAKYIRDEASCILVMVGAGMSTPSGIPDFRTPGTGLYDNLQKYNLPYPEAIFDIHYFMMDPRPFQTLAQDLYPGENYKPNVAHFFLRLLHEEGKLLMVYTQNIDGLERSAM